MDQDQWIFLPWRRATECRRQIHNGTRWHRTNTGQVQRCKTEMWRRLRVETKDMHDTKSSETMVWHCNSGNRTPSFHQVSHVRHTRHVLQDVLQHFCVIFICWWGRFSKYCQLSYLTALLICFVVCLNPGLQGYNCDQGKQDYDLVAFSANYCTGRFSEPFCPIRTKARHHVTPPGYVASCLAADARDINQYKRAYTRNTKHETELMLDWKETESRKRK